MSNDRDKIVQYYQAELAYLRDSGMEFAKRYPKIAEKLDISKSVSSDPHVERMIESFAYMTGKLQKQIDDQFPDFAYTLLSFLYEPLTLPVPSIAMLYFDTDMRLAQKSPGIRVEKGTQVYAKTDDEANITCTFKICQDVEFWPVELLDVKVLAKDDTGLKEELYSQFYLNLKLKWHDTGDEKRPKFLQFYINGDNKFKGELFANLFIDNRETFFLQDGKVVKSSGVGGIGITEEEAILPYSKNIFRGFRLLHEYFYFPDKFYGFRVVPPIVLNGEFEIFIPIKRHINLPKGQKSLLMNCCPIVNLFDKVTDPLRLTYQNLSYKLVADSYRNSSTEIMTVRKVFKVDQLTNQESEVFNFFSASHNQFDKAKDIAWFTKRQKSCQAGDDVNIYFVDHNLDITCPTDKMFYAYTTCTNRHIAELIPAYTEFNIEQTLPVSKIYCLHRPTPQRKSIDDGEAAWNAIALLSNSFSVNFETKIREILKLFANNASESAIGEVDSIKSINVKNVAKLYKDEAWKGFIRGTSININFDNSAPSNGMLLSYILSNLLSTYTSINTFTELVTLTKDMGEKKWGMNLGLHNYL